jgi:hypothetical protein
MTFNRSCRGPAAAFADSARQLPGYSSARVSTSHAPASASVNLNPNPKPRETPMETQTTVSRPIDPPAQRRRLSVDEWNAEGVTRYGTPARKWKFVCPSCKTVQTGQDLMDAGLSKDDTIKYLAFSCIGRFVRGKGCDWTLGGLFQIHTLEVTDEAGIAHPRFEFADHVPSPSPAAA